MPVRIHRYSQFDWDARRFDNNETLQNPNTWGETSRDLDIENWVNLLLKFASYFMRRETKIFEHRIAERHQ